MFTNDKEKVNETIELMIRNFNKYITNMSDRLKINSLFNEFEDKAREDLISLVKLSNTRYKGVKSGNSLDNVIEKQLPVYQEIIRAAIKDEFYANDEIFLEKKKFRKMNNKKENIEIYNLRQNIKENVKSLNLEENGQNLYEGGGEHRNANLKMLDRLKNIKSPMMEELNHGKLVVNKLHDKKNKINPLNLGKTDLASKDEGNDEESNTDRIFQFSEMLQEDQSKFEDQMKLYHTHLNSLIQESEIINSKKYTFLTDDIKILSYKKASNNNVVEKKDDNNIVEVKKLMKYTKNKNEKEKLSSDLISLPINTLHRRNSMSQRGSIMPFIPSMDMIKNHKAKSNAQIEKGNTTKIVKQEIINSMFIEDLLRQKRNGLNNLLKENELPKMEDYDRVLMRNVTTNKISKQTAIAPNAKKEKNTKESNKKGFANTLNENYNNKQVQWKVENFQKDNLEQLEKERRKETKLFLNQVKKRPRFAQQFIDNYSQRDQNVNKSILELNKILGKHYYDKKKLNKKIDEFICDIDRKNQEEEEKVNNSLNRSRGKDKDDLKRIIALNVSDDDEQPYVIFGNRENEIVHALVKDAKENYYFTDEKNDYDDFQRFKDKVVAADQEKIEKNILAESQRLKSKTTGIIRRNSLNAELKTINTTPKK